MREITLSVEDETYETLQSSGASIALLGKAVDRLVASRRGRQATLGAVSEAATEAYLMSLETVEDVVTIGEDDAHGDFAVWLNGDLGAGLMLTGENKKGTLEASPHGDQGRIHVWISMSRGQGPKKLYDADAFDLVFVSANFKGEWRVFGALASELKRNRNHPTKIKAEHFIELHQVGSELSPWTADVEGLLWRAAHLRDQALNANIPPCSIPTPPPSSRSSTEIAYASV